MARKIRITEAQLEKCLNENDEINVAYKKPANGTPTTTDMHNQLYSAKKSAPNADINLQVSQSDLGVNEMKSYTKNEINEARVKNLRRKSEVFTKKQLKTLR